MSSAATMSHTHNSPCSKSFMILSLVSSERALNIATSSFMYHLSIKAESAEILSQLFPVFIAHLQAIVTPLDSFGRTRGQHHAGRLAAFTAIGFREELENIQDARLRLAVIFRHDPGPVFPGVVNLLLK